MQGNRSNRKDNRGFNGLETLEGRTMFNSVPLSPPMVLSAEFDDSRAPHELRVRFSSDVSESLDGSDIVLFNELGRFVFPSERVTVNWDAETNTAHFVFVRAEGGVLDEGTWHARLLAAGIADRDGNQLDGDGDELPGGDYQLTFNYNAADFTNDGLVDLADFNVLAANFGQSGRDHRQGDVNYDGRVDLTDFNILATRLRNDTDPPLGAPASFASEQPQPKWSPTTKLVNPSRDIIELG